jgi:hypothetical protein
MRHILLLFIFTAILSGLVQPAQSAVWKTTNQWSPDWELKYQEWVLNNWDKDFFKRPGFYQNVAMDCADTVYSMRLIYSSLNGLPFAMQDPTGSGVISNEMSRWDSLPADKRLRAFLLYIFEMGDTASLPNDTYPVAPNRESVTSGALILTDRLSHHSWTIKYVSNIGVPFLLFSSRPARTQLFERYEFPSMEFTFPNGLKPERNAGIRAFRQPAWIGKPVWQVPGYSLEQYQLPYDKWISTMQRRLALQTETAEARASRILTEVCKGASERVDIIRLGVATNARIGSRCMNSQEYDDYSTPNRDKRMKDGFIALEEAYRDAVNVGTFSNVTLKQKLESVLSGENSKGDLNAFCTTEIAPGVTMTLGQIYARSLGGKLSNNPHDTLEMRWGLQVFPSSKAQSCPVY